MLRANHYATHFLFRRALTVALALMPLACHATMVSLPEWLRNKPSLDCGDTFVTYYCLRYGVHAVISPMDRMDRMDRMTDRMDRTLSTPREVIAEDGVELMVTSASMDVLSLDHRFFDIDLLLPINVVNFFGGFLFGVRTLRCVCGTKIESVEFQHPQAVTRKDVTVRNTSLDRIFIAIVDDICRNPEQIEWLADLSFHSIVDDDFTILCYLDLSYNQIIILSDSNFRKSTISFSGGNVSVAWYQQNEYCLVFAAMRLNNVLFKDCIKYANEDPSEDLYEDPNENQRKNRYIPLVHILDSNVIIRNEQGDSLNLEISTIQQQAFDSVCIYQFICHTPLWSTSHTPLLSTGALARVRIWSATFLGSSISNGVCAFSRIRQILITAEDIGIRSFYFSHIREIIFSNRVRSIGYQAFSECNNLESVVFEPGTDNRPISTDGFVRREPFQGKSIDLYIYDYAFFKSPICLVWLPARLTHLGSHSLWNVSDVTFHMDCAPECVDPRAVGETTVSLRGPSNVLSGLSPAKSCHITVTDPPRRGDRYSQ